MTTSLPSGPLQSPFKVGEVPTVSSVRSCLDVTNTFEIFFGLFLAFLSCVGRNGQTSNLLPQMSQKGEDPEAALVLEVPGMLSQRCIPFLHKSCPRQIWPSSPQWAPEATQWGQAGDCASDVKANSSGNSDAFSLLPFFSNKVQVLEPCKLVNVSYLRDGISQSLVCICPRGAVWTRPAQHCLRATWVESGETDKSGAALADADEGRPPSTPSLQPPSSLENGSTMTHHWSRCVAGFFGGKHSRLHLSSLPGCVLVGGGR